MHLRNFQILIKLIVLSVVIVLTTLIVDEMIAIEEKDFIGTKSGFGMTERIIETKWREKHPHPIWKHEERYATSISRMFDVPLPENEEWIQIDRQVTGIFGETKIFCTWRLGTNFPFNLPDQISREKTIELVNRMIKDDVTIKFMISDYIRSPLDKKNIENMNNITAMLIKHAKNK